MPAITSVPHTSKFLGNAQFGTHRPAELTFLVLDAGYCYASVWLLVTRVSPAKTAESIEMPFGETDYMGQGTIVLDGVRAPPGEYD